MPPPATSRPPSCRSPPAPPPRSEGPSRLGCERKPGVWLACSREEEEQDSPRPLPTLSPRLSYRGEGGERETMKKTWANEETGRRTMMERAVGQHYRCSFKPNCTFLPE